MALVGLESAMAPIFRQVVETQDRYGLHAYLTAVENADCRRKLEEDLQASTEIGTEEKNSLLKVLQTGVLPTKESGATQDARSEAPSLR